MDMLNLLIADGSEEFGSALKHALQDLYHIHCCSNGREALDYLLEHEPEVMVLDLLIPELDGISLLHCASRQGVRPVVLATTRLITSYITEVANELNIGYMMIKPCDVSATADRVKELTRHVHTRKKPDIDPNVFTDQVLKSLCVPSRLRGFRFLRDAVVSAAMHPEYAVTKDLYPCIGALHSSTGSQVERSIRNAINQAWMNQDPTVWAQFFPAESDGSISRPSNGNFIFRLAELLRTELDIPTDR